MAPRPMSATIMIRLRSSRSTSAPANGPNSTAGACGAIITPADRRAPPARWPREPATSAATAENPTQSPERRDGHRRQQPGERRVGQEILERRRPGPAERGDLVGEARHALPTPSAAWLRRRLLDRAAPRRGRRRGFFAAGFFFFAAVASSRPASSPAPSSSWRRARRGLAPRPSPRGRPASASTSPDLVTLKSQVQLRAAVPAPEALRAAKQEPAALGARLVLHRRVARRRSRSPGIGSQP